MIMSVLDRNFGLDHLRDDEETWARKLYVEMVEIVDFDVADDGEVYFK